MGMFDDLVGSTAIKEKPQTKVMTSKGMFSDLVESPEKQVFLNNISPQEAGERAKGIFDTAAQTGLPLNAAETLYNSEHNLNWSIAGEVPAQTINMFSARKTPAKGVKKVKSIYDEAIEATARGLARVGSGLATTLNALNQAYEKAHPGQMGLYTAGTRPTITEKDAQLLWEVAKRPEIAATRDDLAGKAINVIFETIPYITATTIAAAPTFGIGGFFVGASVEGNSAYRTALDYGVDEQTARNIGVGVGLVNGAIETIGGRTAGALLDRVVGKIADKTFKKVASFGVGMVVEALEEGTQELSTITGESTYKDVPWKEIVNRTAASMAGGAFLGGVFRAMDTAIKQSVSLSAGLPETPILEEVFAKQPTEKSMKIETPDKVPTLNERLAELTKDLPPIEESPAPEELGTKPAIEAKGQEKQPITEIVYSAQNVKNPKIDYADATDLQGIYFTRDKDVAEGFIAERPLAKVRQYQVTLNNPATQEVVDNKEEEARELGYRDPHLWPWVTEELKAEGYDGAILEGMGGDEIIAFNESAYKLIPRPSQKTVPEAKPIEGVKIPNRPLVNPKASAMQQDKQLRRQQAWDKKYSKEIAAKEPISISINRIETQYGETLADAAIKHVKGLKKKYPDTIILTKIGDFYEAFDKDAEILGKELGLTISTRTSGLKLAGVPYHSVDQYAKKLIENGHKVALAEQVEEAKPIEGVKEPEEGKYPYEMTIKERFENPNIGLGTTEAKVRERLGDVVADTLIKGHKVELEQALSEGKPVPPEVLAEYPELKQAETKGVKEPKETKPKEAGTAEIPPPLNIETDISNPDELPSLTSARQADIAEERESLGLDTIASPERQSKRDWQKQAIAEGIPDRALDIANEIIRNPRPMTKIEEEGLLVARARAKKQYRLKVKELSTSTDEAAKKSLSTELERLEMEYEALSRADALSGSEQARALVSRQTTIDEDMELVSVLARAREMKGKLLTAKERAELTQKILEVQELSDKIAELEKQINELAAHASTKEKGVRKYNKMTLQQKDAELDKLITKAAKLLEEGCY